MRLREILPENWWKDLDSGFMKMMGYGEEPSIKNEVESDLATQVSKDMKSVKRRHRSRPL